MKNLRQDMIARMAKASLRASRMRNGFVMLTIVLASACLWASDVCRRAGAEPSGDLTPPPSRWATITSPRPQVEALQRDERIAYQIQVKTGCPRGWTVSVVLYYVSEMSDHIPVGALTQGGLPRRPTRWPSRGHAGADGPACRPGHPGDLPLYDGNTETFTVTGLLAGKNTSQFSLFFSQAYAETGSQLAGGPMGLCPALQGPPP